MPRPLAAAIALIACVAVLLSAAAAAASWRAPVGGRVVGAFTYSPRAPFARGARRGVDFAARPGDRVRAPCGGHITFAGRVPRFGPAVSIRCGALVATLLGVRASPRGNVRRGRPLGVATGPVLRLGARIEARRWGYVDPLALIGPPPVGAAPPAALPVRAPRRPHPAAPAAVAARVPWPAWAGLGLLGSLLGPWVISTSRRRSTTSTLRRILATRTR